MRRILLTALIVLLGVGNRSADGFGWNFGGTGGHGFFHHGHFGHDYYHHGDGEDDGEDGYDTNGSDENGSHGGDWHTDGYGFFGHGWYGGLGHGWHGDLGHGWYGGLGHGWHGDLGHGWHDGLGHGWHDGLGHGWHDGLGHGWHGDLGHGWHGDLGHGWHDGLGDGWHGGVGWGHASRWDPKERIEAKFSHLMDIYETGLEEIEDFFESDEYDHIIDGMEWMIGKHDWYLEHVEHKADRLCDVISHLEDKLYSYQEHWDEHRWDHLPESWQAWIAERHAAKEEWLTQAVDSLTEKKSNLQDRIDMHMSLNDDLNNYLDEILGAGGVNELVSEALEANELVAVASSSPGLAPLTADSGTVVSGVPEPTAAALATLGLLGIGVGLSGRRRSRRT